MINRIPLLWQRVPGVHIVKINSEQTNGSRGLWRQGTWSRLCLEDCRRCDCVRLSGIGTRACVYVHLYGHVCVCRIFRLSGRQSKEVCRHRRPTPRRRKPATPRPATGVIKVRPGTTRRPAVEGSLEGRPVELEGSLQRVRTGSLVYRFIVYFLITVTGSNPTLMKLPVLFSAETNGRPDGPSPAPFPSPDTSRFLSSNT